MLDQTQAWQHAGASRFTAPDVVDDHLRYNVFVLGMRGSGKTVFLACMHRRLSVEHTENRFFIDIDDPEKEKQLDDTYQEIVRPDLEWPPGSSVVSGYEFRCLHTTKDGPRPLFRIAYTDYPGTVMEAARGKEELVKEIRQKTASAHAIIALIDGHKVLQSMESENGLDALESDLKVLTRRLAHSAAKPVIFLLTKYDLLAGKYSLGRIRRQLFESDDFRSFVQLRRLLRLPLHLIPISAVGSNFATFDAATGRMKKIKGGVARPLNLEFALGCTVINQFKLFEEERLDGSWKATIREKTSVLAQWLIDGHWQIPGIGVRILPRKILESFELAGLSVENRLGDLLARIAKDEQSAIEIVFEIMALRLAALRAKEPEIDLTLET
jgi:hypothetical protein